MIEDITPSRAWSMLNEDGGVVLLDVRSRVEHDYVGHPPGAVLVAAASISLAAAAFAPNRGFQALGVALAALLLGSSPFAARLIRTKCSTTSSSSQGQA